MIRIAFGTSLLGLALAGSPAAQDCPIQGITTVDVGQGTGVYTPSTLLLSWDADACNLLVQVDTLTCCNVYLTSHFVAIGTDLLPVARPLGGRFLPGSDLLVRLNTFFGLLPGTSSILAIPPDASLLGLTFAAQAAPVFFTTIGNRTQYGITQAVLFTFG